MRRLLLILVLAVGLPAAALGQESPAAEPADDAGEPADAEEPADEAAPGEATPPSENDAKAAEDDADPLEAKMLELAQRYYAGTGEPAPGASDVERAVQSIQLMLLDGVSLDRIAAAVEEAISLHTPGRRIPFEVAVPLRVRPAERSGGTADAGGTGEGDGVTESRAPRRSPVRELTPEEEERRAELRRERSAARARLRLYRQWRERTRVKQTLLGVGIPLLASGYAIGFGHAGILALNGLVPHYSAWITAVPIVGNFILTIWTSAEFPASIVLTVLEWGGLGLIIAGVAQKIDWPYERDPTAWRIGKRKRDGRPALTMRAVPSGAGGMLIGRW